MNTNRQVSLMLSGGLDSYIAYYYAKSKGYEVLPIVVNIGNPYHPKEMEAISQFEFYNEVREIDCPVLKPEYNNLPTKDDWIIPARNLLFATIGAMYSPRVWICALETELHRETKNADKTPEFYFLTSGLLTFVCGMVRQETILETPFAEMSKAEIVRWALQNGISKERLLATSSCYDDHVKNCGNCVTCFNRNVALTLNGIREEYAENPWTSETGVRYVTNMFEAVRNKDFSHYKEKRVKETIQALLISGEYKDLVTQNEKYIQELA